MNAYKKCPVCGSRNAEFEAICAGCFADISTAGISFENDGEGSKICSGCGNSNPDYSAICDNCGADISAIQSRGGTAAAGEKKRVFLFSKEDRIVIEVSDGLIIGRCDRCVDHTEREKNSCGPDAGKKNFIDCEKFDTVSRNHAKIIFENGACFIMPLPESKNLTGLNNEKLVRGMKYKLSDGDTLDLSKKLKLTVFIK